MPARDESLVPYCLPFQFVSKPRFPIWTMFTSLSWCSPNQVTRASRRCLPPWRRFRPRRKARSRHGPSARSRGVPRQPLDACDDLPKQRPCQVTFGELQGEVSGMPDQAPAGLEEPLLETRQRPTLNGAGQDEPSQQIAKIVGDHPEEQPDLVGPEAVAREARPMGGFLAFLDPLLRRPALIVETDDGSVRPGQGGHDEPHPS